VDLGEAATIPAESDLTETRKLDAPAPSQPDSSIASPIFVPSEDNGSITQSPLTLIVTAPDSAKRDETVSFQVKIRNDSQNDLSDVELHAKYDRPFNFPGVEGQELAQKFSVIPAGETRELTLALTVVEYGLPCVRFSLQTPLYEDRIETRCVDVSPPPLELSWDGPDEQSVNNRAEFVLTIHNHSGKEVSQANVAVQYVDALAPRAGSAGVIRRPGQLVWDLGTMRIDERVRIEMQFECLNTIDPALLTAEISSQGESILEQNHKIRITHGTTTIGLPDSRE